MSALNHPPDQPLFEFLVELATLLETGKIVCTNTCPADAKSLAHSMRNYAWIVMNQVAYNQIECEKCLAEVRAQLIRARALVNEYKALLYGTDKTPDNTLDNESSPAPAPTSSPTSSQEPGVPSERGSQRPVDRLPKQRKGRKRKESGDEEEEDDE